MQPKTSKRPMETKKRETFKMKHILPGGKNADTEKGQPRQKMGRKGSEKKKGGVKYCKGNGFVVRGGTTQGEDARRNRNGKWLGRNGERGAVLTP